MFRFILADLKRLWAGSIVIVILIMLATALGVAVTLEERALRLGSARASEKFDLVIGAPGSETQLVLSSVFLQAADGGLDQSLARIGERDRGEGGQVERLLFGQ